MIFTFLRLNIYQSVWLKRNTMVRQWQYCSFLTSGIYSGITLVYWIRIHCESRRWKTVCILTWQHLLLLSWQMWDLGQCVAVGVCVTPVASNQKIYFHIYWSNQVVYMYLHSTYSNIKNKYQTFTQELSVTCYLGNFLELSLPCLSGYRKFDWSLFFFLFYLQKQIHIPDIVA